MIYTNFLQKIIRENLVTLILPVRIIILQSNQQINPNNPQNNRNSRNQKPKIKTLSVNPQPHLILI